MLRVASSCSYVNCIPRWFAPPQPKQELVGLGVSSILAIVLSPQRLKPPLVSSLISTAEAVP
jgi:hypothetical protein